MELNYQAKIFLMVVDLNYMKQRLEVTMHK